MSQIMNQTQRNTQWTLQIHFAVQEVEMESAGPRVALQRLRTAARVPPVPVPAPAGGPAAGQFVPEETQWDSAADASVLGCSCGA